MDLTEDQIFERYVKKSLHCSRNGLLLYEYDFTCFSCSYNIIKHKIEQTKIQRKKINFINRLKYAEYKIFCNCIDVFKLNEGEDFNEIYKTFYN